MITTGLQLALLGGGLAGAGAATLMWRIVPSRPDLGDVLLRLSPEGTRRTHDAEPGDGSMTERLGRWGMKVLPASVWGNTPHQQRALLRVSLARLYGQKLVYAMVGMLIPPGFSTLLLVLGWRLPILIPVGATLGMAVVMFMLPDHNLREDAKKARAEFARALGAYADLVALERLAGSGPRQAMEVAAKVGDSWVFRRLREELALSAWTGEPPWDALRRLSRELGLPELGDLADIVRLGGEEGAQIYSQLRARSASMRAAMLNAELSRANEASEKLSIPMSILGMVFLFILIIPALLRVVI